MASSKYYTSDGRIIPAAYGGRYGTSGYQSQYRDSSPAKTITIVAAALVTATGLCAAARTYFGYVPMPF